MYFGDLFAEIEANAAEEPPMTSIVASSAPLPPSSSHSSTQVSVLPFPADTVLAQPVLDAATTADSLAFLPEDGEDGDDEHSEGVHAVAAAAAAAAVPVPSQMLETSPVGDGGMGPADAERPSGKRRKQELHRRHSKRYRDNLGELFHELEQILPQVVPDCKLKTKSQIIATSVSAVKQLKTEVSTLEMRYVMSSAANRSKWVEETVAAAGVIQDAVEPFMRLLLRLQNWKHAELWMRIPTTSPGASEEDGSFSLRLDRVTSANDPTRNGHSQRYLEFVKGSQVLTFSSGDDSLVGRIATSLSPEWLDLNNDAAVAGFKRGELALRCGLVVCFAVPFLIRGHVKAVVLFYDNTPRGDVMQRISIAQDLASAIGNCYGAHSARKLTRARVER